MRLSSTLTLSLLSFNHHLSSASARINHKQPEIKPASPAAAAKGSADRRRRMLQKTEKRMLQKGNGNGNGNGNTSTSGGSSGNNGKSNNGNGNGRNDTPKGGNKEHSSHLDANNNGITLDAVEYEYGTPVQVSFELTNDLVPYDVQLGLDLAEMPNWTMGVFMRMADPQGGVLSPIASVTPTIFDAPTRKLQETEEESTTTTTSTPPPMGPEETQEPPVLNHVGTATFTATDAITLDWNLYGTGFDIYLLDENGAEISGPATFYMLKTDDMKIAEAEATNKKSNHPLAKYNHSHKKPAKGQGNGGKGNSGKNSSGKVQGGKPDAKGQGYGSGANGGMIIGTGAESLATYILESDKLDYVMGEDVIVTYDLSPVIDTDGGGGRRLQKGGNGNSNGNGNQQPTTTQATMSAGGNSGNNGNGNNQQSTTTQATTTNAATTTEATTTMEATTTPDMGPDEEGTTTMPEDIDNTDITLFSMGVYMRMAHPQGGQLLPIYSVPFCSDATNCNATPEELETGTFTFSTNVLDLGEYGGGYDIWILNGSGGGIAGPFTFYVAEATEE